jgi:thymidine kinase
MAKLYFYYSSMNAGKSTNLLQSSYNYKERGMNTLVLAPQFDDRYGPGRVTSRIGIETEATTFTNGTDIYDVVAAATSDEVLHCVLIDEAQFLTRDQVFQLSEVTDKLGVPVLCYGLRTDFQGEPFEGSKYLLAWADSLKELKAICHCGTKATMVLRMDENGNAVTEGSPRVRRSKSVAMIATSRCAASTSRKNSTANRAAGFSGSEYCPNPWAATRCRRPPAGSAYPPASS